MSAAEGGAVHRLSWPAAEAWLADALGVAGLGADQAAAVAWGLCEAEAGGIGTHGIVRALHYAESVRAGRVTPDPRVTETSHGVVTLIDAAGGYGFLPMRRLVDGLAERAGRDGMAVGGVRNSHHFGAAWLYATRAARAGLAAIVMTNATANLAGPGARRPVVGNNPLAIAVPGPAATGPVCGDIAMSAVAQGNIRLAQRLGERIPPGWARDGNGEPTTDPTVALDAALLEPIGGHKGFVLATLIELLAGLLTGSPFGATSAAHDRAEGGVGHLAILLDPDRFIDRAELERGVTALAGEIRDAAEGADIARMPGWAEEAARREAARHGLVVDDRILDRLAELRTSDGNDLLASARLVDDAGPG